MYFLMDNLISYLINKELQNNENLQNQPVVPSI